MSKYSHVLRHWGVRTSIDEFRGIQFSPYRLSQISFHFNDNTAEKKKTNYHLFFTMMKEWYVRINYSIFQSMVSVPITHTEILIIQYSPPAPLESYHFAF